MLRAFAERFGGAASLIVHAPGRVNLLGEHTDYNDGFVLPMALHLGAWIALRPRDGRPRGAALARFRRGAGVRPARASAAGRAGSNTSRARRGRSRRRAHACAAGRACSTGEVPIGAGLSSSAALEVASARAFLAAADLPWQPVAAARLAQRAENGWVGMQCGIMDQLVIACGREDHALLIDCRDLSTRPIPLPRGTVVAVLDTSTRRDLVDSTYNDRRARCEEATRRLRRARAAGRRLRTISSARWRC